MSVSVEGREPWETYGQHEALIREFVAKYSEASLVVTSFEITASGLLRGERLFTDTNDLWNFLHVVPTPESTSLRVLVVKELSGKGLQALSTALGIHLGFWAWIISDDASDGFWLNTHNDGKILSFDLPCLEFYAATTAPTTGVVREGRLKHLSSIHRLFGDGLSNRESYDVYINRRVSTYIVPHGDRHTFVYFSEDCRAVSSIRMNDHFRTDPISPEWFISVLKETERAMRVEWTQEPVGLILRCVRKLLGSWHVFTVQTQRDLEKIDASLPESLPQELPVHNLYDIGAYLHRDIVQTLYRFDLQLGKYDGYLNYLCNGTLDHFRPKRFMHDIGNLKNNVRDLQRRLEGCKDRGNGSLALINNYISLQQARLAHDQAVIAAEVAVIQQEDSQSTGRLSIVATVFLPLSFAVAFLGSIPLWSVFLIAIVSMFATTFIIMVLKFIHTGQVYILKERFKRLFFKRSKARSSTEEDKMSVKIDMG